MNSVCVILGVLCGMASLALFNGIPFMGIEGALSGILSWPWMPLISLSVTIITAFFLHFILLALKIKKT